MEQLRMTRDSSPAPLYKIPENYSIRAFRNGDEEDWCRCCVDGELNVKEIGVNQFKLFMTPDKRVDLCNIFFIVSVSDGIVGTATYQYGNAPGEAYIHMVGIMRSHRGKGLARPLLLYVIEQIIKDGNETIYLTTDDWRLPAIKAYINCGFKPIISDCSFEKRWSEVYRLMNLTFIC